MRILVTGGAGYIGSFCARYLVSQGFVVTAMDNFITGSRQAFPSIYEGDVTDYDSLMVAMRNVDAVMHFAALASVPDSIAMPAPYWDTNFRGTIQVLEAMRMSRVKRLIFSGTAAVYDKDVQPPIKENS